MKMAEEMTKKDAEKLGVYQGFSTEIEKINAIIPGRARKCVLRGYSQVK